MTAVAPIVVLLFCLSLGIQLAAQPSSASSSVPPAQAPVLPGTQAGTVEPSKPVPPLPGSKTRADTFRELLAMTPAAREEALSDRTEHQRKYLESSLQKFESLPPALREARLKQLELRCHLLDLMKLAPAHRERRLETVSADLRPLIQERLRQWDLLPPKVQQDVLEHETTSNYFLRVRPAQALPPNRQHTPAGLPLPGEGQGKWAAHITEFFELTPKEQQKTILAVPAADREKMEATLNRFAALPPEQRRICIDSFEKLSRMTLAERNQFLKNAARWKAMSPRERETWRALVEMLPPTPGGSTLPPLPGNEVGHGPATASNSVTGPPVDW